MKHLQLTTIVAVLLVGCGKVINPEANRALIDAAWNGNIEAVEQHLAAGADVNVKDGIDETPLDEAIENDETEIADLLRKHGGKTGEELKAAGN